MTAEWTMSEITAEEKALILLFRSDNEKAKSLILSLLSGQLPPGCQGLIGDSS